MAESLEVTAAKEFLLRTLKSAGRGAGHIGAFMIAVPVGVFRWLDYDPAATATFMQKNIDDEQRKKELVAAWLEYARQKPTLWQEITAFYKDFRPYNPLNNPNQYSGSAKIYKFKR